jgi:hypothetical protein
MNLTNSLNDQLMAMAAYRYCLGRSSYIVSSCFEWLEKTWDQFDRNTKRVFLRDVVEALMDYEEMAYRQEWQDIANKYYPNLIAEDKKWVKDATSYKNKPWPLS